VAGFVKGETEVNCPFCALPIRVVVPLHAMAALPYGWKWVRQDDAFYNPELQKPIHWAFMSKPEAACGATAEIIRKEGHAASLEASGATCKACCVGSAYDAAVKREREERRKQR
jgi:hypothetical protein